MQLNKIYNGNALDVLKTFPDESVDMVITSPPYWALRDYGAEGQLGLESTFQEYINKLCDIFDDVKRVLKKSGSCWVNLGDTYSGSGKGVGGIKERTKESWVFDKKPTIEEQLPSKSLLQIPSRFAIEMCNRGWILRNEIIWYKPNAMPQSVRDRFTVDFEKLFFFTKNKKYYFKQQKEQMKTNHICGKSTRNHSRMVSLNTTKQNDFSQDLKISKDLQRNKRSVWSINTKPFKEAHFATYPEELIITPIKACCLENGIVLDPFMGSGTTAVVAKGLGLKYVGIELNPDYIKIADKRLAQITIYDCL